ncbi:MAG: hypothetical protein WD049_05200 [Candidatus Paceibacterota bacterium]
MSAFNNVAVNVPGERNVWDKLSFVISRLRERLWIKPLIICVLSIGAVFLADLMDKTGLGRFVPEITKESRLGVLVKLRIVLLKIVELGTCT